MNRDQIFGCEDAAQQVLMSSVHPSVIKLKFYLLTAINVIVYSSRMFQNVSFQNVSEYSGMFQNVSECFRMFQNVPECSRMFQDVPEFSRMYAECMQIVCRMFQNVPECMQNVPE